MRGRDHGIAPYNEFRESAKLNRAKSFDDFFEIPELVRSKLKQIYTNVDDIDAFTGGTSETPMTGALIGPTFASKLNDFCFKKLQVTVIYFLSVCG